MDTQDKARLALALSADRHTFDGAWWPRSRELGDELVGLFAAWPANAGYISRVIFCPRDWDDAPTAVPIPNRRGRVKTGFLPVDDTHRVVLMMLDGQRRTLAVIPQSAAPETANRYLRAFGFRGSPEPQVPVAGPRR
ncbi:hypothetical protein JCM18899A_41740 [Nocardioides sp. AN3]